MIPESELVRRIVLCPGLSDRDVAELEGCEHVSPDTEAVLFSLASMGEIEAAREAIGYGTFGIPIRGTRYYPTADGTMRALRDHIIGNPGCTEPEVNRAFCPGGGIPDWLETDIGCLVRNGEITVGSVVIRSERPGTTVFVRTFHPAKGAGA